MIDLSDRMSLIFEREDAEQATEEQAEEKKPAGMNPLFKLAALNDPQGMSAIERDLASISQATKDSLNSFVKGKGNLENLLRSSDALANVSAEINSAAKEIEHQGGIDYQVSSPIARKLNQKIKKFQSLPTGQQEEMLGVSDDIEAEVDEQGKSKELEHIGSFPLTSGRGMMRVAVEGERTTRGRLHIFKQGNKYTGYLVIPGPGRPRKESFDNFLNLLVEQLIAEANEIVLEYSSNNIRDLFNLANYTKLSKKSADEFAKLDANAIPPHLMSQIKLQGMAWNKERRQELEKEATEATPPPEAAEATPPPEEDQEPGDAEEPVEIPPEEVEPEKKDGGSQSSDEMEPLELDPREIQEFDPDKVENLLHFYTDKTKTGDDRYERKFSESMAKMIPKIKKRKHIQAILKNISRTLGAYGEEDETSNVRTLKRAKAHFEDLLDI